MITNMNRKILLSLLLSFTFVESLQGEEVTETPEPPSVNVRVFRTVNSLVSSTSEYIGKAEAIQSVNLCPEITARITKVHFKEGSFVKEGQTLFSLDTLQFQANVSLRNAQLSQAQANLDKAKKYLSRLNAADKRSVPASDLDVAKSDVQQAEAMVAEAKATLQLARIDLNHTKITAPISGFIGKVQYTRGNYVSDGTVLATITQTNPIRINFSMTDRDYLRNKDSNLSSQIKLADGSLYSEAGTLDFINNTMNAETGTISIWLKFPNDSNILKPGALVRVLLTEQGREMALVPQTSVIAGGEGEFVYVVENGIVHERKIVTGTLQGDMIAVVSGLKAGELVVSEGLQLMYDGARVSIKE